MTPALQVLDDLARALGPIPPRHQPAAAAVGEVYGSPRMALAALPRELLDKAVQGLKCDYHQVRAAPYGALVCLPPCVRELEPLLELARMRQLKSRTRALQVLDNMRAIRPLHGGPGYSEDMVTFVRALNFELD